MKKIFSAAGIVALSLLAVKTNAQLNCATSIHNNELLEKYPTMATQQANYDAALDNYILQNANHLQTRAGNVIIPIVFHIIHSYGNEDISDAQVFDAVRILNNDYNKRNADTTNVVAAFQNNIAKVGFEFRLARLDPNGQCTNGIDRIYSYKTTLGNDMAKLNDWDHTKYFNIWVIQKFLESGVAGYAYYPSSFMGSFPVSNDGVIILSNYIGSIGTGSVGQSRALTHEIGHSFNLPHTWGSTNNPGVACGDDGVNDTPVTKGHTSCTATDLADVNCTGAVENTQNYMEYSYCSNMFTNGQKSRMIAASNNSAAGRNNLSTASNLASTGTATTGLPLCTLKPDFKTNRFFTCLGNYVTLTNKSNGDTATLNYTWAISNTTLTNVNNTTQTPVFTASGWQNVSLTASSANAPTGTLTKNNYIYVSDPAAAKPEGYYQNFENATNNAEWPLFNIYENDFKYSQVPNGRNGGNCIKYNSFDDGNAAQTKGTAYGDYDEMISPAYNIANSTNCKLSFYTSAATNSNSNDTLADILDVLYSVNCGVSWYPLYTATETSNNLFNVGARSSDYTPLNASQWLYREVTLPPSALTNATYFKFRFKPSNASNNLFIDDIFVSPYPLATSNLSTAPYSLEIYPNPSNNGNTTILVQNATNVSVQITDITGKVIQNYNATQVENQHGKLEINTNWVGGLYMVNIYAGNQKVESKKLIVQN